MKGLPAFTALFLSTLIPSSVLAQGSAPPTPRATPRPRVDVAVGFTIVRIRELPPRDAEIGGALSFSASVGYLWTPHLITQVEIADQIENYNWDYAHERVVPGYGGDGTSITLKHNYQGGRRTVAQIVQIGPSWPFRPYFGIGVGIESQTTYDSWYVGSVVGPNLKTVDQFPNELPRTEANYVIVFGEAGVKAFLGRHAYVHLDGKYTNHVLVTFGFGVEFP